MKVDLRDVHQDNITVVPVDLEIMSYVLQDGNDGHSKDVPVNVHIIAPSTLPEGYVLEAEIGAPGSKKTISVEVPRGGVVEGQVFLVPLPDDFAVGEPRIQAPTGRWKDGTFDFCNAGACHASLCCALCCTQGEVVDAYSIPQARL